MYPLFLQFSATASTVGPVVSSLRAIQTIKEPTAEGLGLTTLGWLGVRSFYFIIMSLRDVRIRVRVRGVIYNILGFIFIFIYIY